MNPYAYQQAIFGDVLSGLDAVRFVFVDEAGTSEPEPVTVVVGLVVHADQQLMFAEAKIDEVLGAVPNQFRDGFVFHATDVWSNKEYRDTWSMADRLALLELMMALPSRLKLPLSMGLVPRTAPRLDVHPDLTLAQSHHFLAFAQCLSRADKYIREKAELTEVATVVAEDIPEMRRYLQAIPQALRQTRIIVPRQLIEISADEKALGYMTQQSEMRITRIRRSIHFVTKRDDPILQLADACAFGLRRYFSRQEHGERFARAIFGNRPLPNIDDFIAAGQSGVTWFDHESLGQGGASEPTTPREGQ